MRTPEEQASYIAHLESQVEKLQAKIGELEMEAGRLKKEKGLTREDLKFNEHTGLYANAAGVLYCPKCLDSEKRNPLKKEKRGWRCTAGDHYFENPDAPSPNVANGPGNWMA